MSGHSVNFIHLLNRAKIHRRKKARRIFFVSVMSMLSVFACILLGVYVVTFFHLSDERGEIDKSSRLFESVVKVPQVSSQSSNISEHASLPINTPKLDDTKAAAIAAESVRALQVLCRINALQKISPQNAQALKRELLNGASPHAISNMFMAVDLRIHDNPVYAHEEQVCQSVPTVTSDDVGEPVIHDKNIFPWINDEKWVILQKALTRDMPLMIKAAHVADVDPRILASITFVEQARVYWTAREFFKSVLRPLGLLSTGSNISLGTVNIKPKTAEMIEENLHTPSSPFYPGKDYEKLLDFTSADHAKERIKRLTSYSDTYYSYLYTALYIKEYEAQWEKAGFAIADRPEILATLFNIGFTHSKPSATPNVGGSTLTIGGVHYTFGGLAYEFYYSGVMDAGLPLR